MTKPKKIEELYAWIVTEPDGEDGILGLHGPLGSIPMIGSDKDRIESLRSHAQAAAQISGLPLRLVKFTQMVVLERHPTLQ